MRKGREREREIWIEEMKREKIKEPRERKLQRLTGAVICASIKTQTKRSAIHANHSATLPPFISALTYFPFYSAEIDCINTLAFPMGYLKYLRKCRKYHLRRDVWALSLFLCVRKKKHWTLKSHGLLLMNEKSINVSHENTGHRREFYRN